ncbi:MAG: hypothetical protein JNN17_14810 [Verrucomicrobiaceae bacterium]|nr:hypothetical protein [Verrucomicrobiaceae bacterium]
MAIYVYITEQCRKEIKQQQYTAEVENFKKKVEAAQTLEVFDRFPPPFLKKRFERQIRVVARDIILKDHVVVAFLRLLVRGGNEYKQFGDSAWKVLPGFDGMADELSEANLTTYVNSRQDPPPPPPPKPTDSEESFLHSALNSSENIYQDFHCCETKLWVDTISSPGFKDRKNIFIGPAFETIDASGETLMEAKCKIDPQYGILFRRVPAKKMVILFTPFKGSAPYDAVRERYPELLCENDPDMEAVLRKTKRAYPQELLLNEDAWLQVQNDQDGNMALSFEEIEVLESARRPGGGYPLFINGSAGSGKSTILQYIFSEYLFHHLESGKATKGPVLFACNNELLARSNTSVRSILRARHGRKSEQGQSFDQWIKQNDQSVAASLRNFHEWLQGLAPPHLFRSELLFDYGRFKLWWEDRFRAEARARDLYNADISWHVIRTYIKGISPEGYLEPDDYLEIPSKQKSVTPDTYRIVFEKVWKRYSEDQKNLGYWDHQDLARYVLEHELVSPEHPVVFCDEAQDFTRIELEVLHQHFLFNARTLNSFQLAQTPIAFAGDPFQTLNPTGFRWEATKAFFTDKFIKSFPGQKKGEINYQELTYNYRSSHHIVRFINSLQLIRSVIFGFSEIKPQHPWEDDDDVPLVAYFERTPESLNMLKSQSEIRIIVPCEEGFEGEWAMANGLADYVEFDDAGVPKNVVCPTGVKGLEFPRVVLFGFGAACPPALRNALTHESVELSGDHAIEPQYFWNRLYVAASRPRKRLFIIDSQEHIDGFWNQIFANQDNTILRAQNVAQWDKNMTGQVVKGSPAAWEGDREDPVETARKLENEGRIRKDRTLLRQAAQSYRTANKPSDEKRCRAEALELEKDFLAAAKLWQELQKYDLSIAAAWNARMEGLAFIISLSDQRPDIKHGIHWKFATYLKAQGDFSEGVALIKDLAEALDLPEAQGEILTSAVWPDMILLALNRMLADKATESGMWSVTYWNADKVVKQGIRLPSEVLGNLAFRGALMSEAIRHWNSLPTEARSKFEGQFLQAKAATLPFPQNMDAYGDLLRHQGDRKFADEIITLVQREGRDRINATQLPTLVRAQLIAGDSKSAFGEVERLTDMPLLVSIFELAEKNGDDSVKDSSLKQIITQLANQDLWASVVELLRKGRTEGVSISSLELRAKSSPRVYARPFIDAFVQNRGIEGARNDLKTLLAEWLKTHFPSTFSWYQEIHPLLVGRAFERAGLFRETLPFYEALAASSFASEDLKKWAWLRWAKTKSLQSTREREMNAVGRAEKAMKEANEKAALYGFRSPDSIPDDLPDPLPSIVVQPAETSDTPEAKSPLAQPDKPMEHAKESVTPTSTSSYARTVPIGELQIRVSPDGKRVNIEHSITLQIASVNVAKKLVTIDGETVPINSDGQVELPTQEWGLVIVFDRLMDGKLSLISKDGLEISVPVLVR